MTRRLNIGIVGCGVAGLAVAMLLGRVVSGAGLLGGRWKLDALKAEVTHAGTR